MKLTIAAASAFGLVAAIAGCGRTGPVADIADTVPVSGTLTWQGKPLAGFRVTLIPVAGIRASVGTSDDAGRFVLGTNDAADGAEAGQHKVAVVWSDYGSADDGLGDVVDDPRKLPRPPMEIPAKYSNPETSGIVVDIPAGGTDSLQIDLR